MAAKLQEKMSESDMFPESQNLLDSGDEVKDEKDTHHGKYIVNTHLFSVIACCNLYSHQYCRQ